MKTKYLYILGAESGVGKSTLCEGLLAQLLSNGYRSEQLAYIKPVTQCISKQAVTAFCEQQNIAHQSIGSLVFKKGFSKDFIDGLTKNSAQLLQDILIEIKHLSTGKDIVIVDGIGSPSTGSVIGISNATIALSLNAPVLYIGKAGIGAAIDDTILAVTFLQRQGIQKIALVYNKIEITELDCIQHYVRKRLAELLPDIPVLEFIAYHTRQDHQTKQHSTHKILQWFNSLTF